PTTPVQETVLEQSNGLVDSRQSGAESVRVAVGKLDALLAQTGELTVANIRVEERLGELRLLQHELDQWRRELREGRSAKASLRRSLADTDLSPSARRDQQTLLQLAEHVEDRT